MTEATANRAHPNYSYDIVTTTLEDGRVRARLKRGEVKVKTFPADVGHTDAAMYMARTVEGKRLDRVSYRQERGGEHYWTAFVVNLNS